MWNSWRDAGISKGRLGCRWKREQGLHCTGAYGKSCRQGGGHFICLGSITSSRYLWIFYLFSASGMQIKALGGSCETESKQINPSTRWSPERFGATGTGARSLNLIRPITALLEGFGSSPSLPAWEMRDKYTWEMRLV